MAKKKEITIRSSAAEYLTFISAVGDQPGSVELRYQDENIWLTQRLMAELYGVDIPTINYHIQQIYKDNELTEGATIRNFLIVQTEGTRQVSREVSILLDDAAAYERMSKAVNPYGDGKACSRIVRALNGEPVDRYEVK